METISSRENQWVKEYARLASSKRARAEAGRFVIEGVKLCREALESGVVLEAVFMTADCRDKYSGELSPLLVSCECYEISTSLLGRFSEQKTPQGVFAIAHSLDKLLTLDTIGKGGHYLYLCGLQDAGNVGTMIRTAEAVGLEGVLLTNDTCDPFSPKVVRGSMGAVFRMPLCFTENPEEFVAELAQYGVSSYASVLGAEALPLTGVVFERSAVLLVGNEGNGLSSTVSAKCKYRITIPMKGKAESLNASMAGCILMWEMQRN